jgi:ABC-type amino acid transport substrate-binding protein
MIKKIRLFTTLLIIYGLVGFLFTTDSCLAVNDEITPSESAKIVKVGGYSFPPYVQEDEGDFSGLTLDMIQMINAFQNKYHFVFVPTSPMRRYKDFKNNVYDMILFESIDWGWKDIPVEASKVFAKDCEVFVARAEPNRDQRFFDIIKGKSLLVYLGYHYPFAGYNADPAYLLKKFNARTTVSHEANLRSVIAGRADLAVVTRSFLSKWLRENPDLIPKLLISDRIEQVYEHTALIRKGLAPCVEEINKLLEDMQGPGYISILLGKYGIKTSRLAQEYEFEEERVPGNLASKRAGAIKIRVGGYHFPPYVEHREGKFMGLTLDLVKLLNAYQSKYRFEFIPTTPLTRYQDFNENRFDMIFFERKEWGWEDKPVLATREFLRDSEVYVTSLKKGETQDYFKDIKGKSILGYLGYHYPIVDYETNPEILSEKYGMKVTSSHRANIQSALLGETDLAIVTKSYVTRYLRNNPALIPRILISDRIVQEYRHTSLLRKGLEMAPKEFMAMLGELQGAGYVDFLWGKYDVKPISKDPNY